MQYYIVRDSSGKFWNHKYNIWTTLINEDVMYLEPPQDLIVEPELLTKELAQEIIESVIQKRAEFMMAQLKESNTSVNYLTELFKEE